LKNGGFLAHRNHQGVEMSQKSGTAKSSSERIVKDIRRATRKQYSAEEKIRIVSDVAKTRNAIAIAEGERNGEGDFDASLESMRRLVQAVGSQVWPAPLLL
jgi:hypothetical protein